MKELEYKLEGRGNAQVVQNMNPDTFIQCIHIYLVIHVVIQLGELYVRISILLT